LLQASLGSNENGSIVIRCYEFDKMLAFWQEALHYVPREPAKDGWVVLHDPAGKGPNVSLDQVMTSSCWQIPMTTCSVVQATDEI
jgi:hypothetical protein